MIYEMSIEMDEDTHDFLESVADRQETTIENLMVHAVKRIWPNDEV